MNWNKITVGQYQELLPIMQDESLTDLDRLVKVICVLTGKSEFEVDSWPLNKINEFRYLFDFDFKKEAKKRISVNGRHYRINWKVSEINAARYIESKTYAGDGLFKNLHKIMASCVIPQRKIGFVYFDKKYNAADHEKYAADMLDAPFPFVYNACVFFLQIIKGIDGSYPVLFGEGVREPHDDEPDGSIERVFNRHYGWIYSATIVADHERITLDQAFELPVLQFLNDLAYLKMFKKLEAKQMEDIRLKK